MVLIYVIAGIGVLIGIAALGIYIHRAAKAQGKLESNNDCDKRILTIKTELAKKIYGDGLSHFPVDKPDGMWPDTHKADDTPPAA